MYFFKHNFKHKTQKTRYSHFFPNSFPLSKSKRELCFKKGGWTAQQKSYDNRAIQS